LPVFQLIPQYFHMAFCTPANNNYFFSTFPQISNHRREE